MTRVSARRAGATTRIRSEVQGRRLVRVIRGWHPGLPGTLLAIVSALTGCATVGPDYERPTAPVASQWIDEGAAGISNDSRDYRDWWTAFGDPRLDVLVQMAYRQNLTLRAAALRILEARARLGIAVGTSYPQVQLATGAAGGSRLSLNDAPFASLPDEVRNDIDPTIGSYGLGVEAAWEIDFWGRFRRGIEASEAELAGSIAGYDDVLVSLTADVALTYVLIRTIEKRLAFARQNVAIQQRSLDIANVRFENGLTTELDAQQARSLLRSTEALIPDLESDLRQARNALSVLVGISPVELDSVLETGGGAIPQPPDNVAVGIPAELLRRRPDVRLAELNAAAQSARIGVAQADLYPAFSLSGALGLAAVSSGDVFDSDSRTGFGAFGFRWPFLNYGRLANNVRVQDARFQALVAAYQNTVLQAVREVEDGLIGYRKARERVGYLADGVQASERSVELSNFQYSEGLADYTRVLDTQRTLLSQQDTLTRSQGDVVLNVISVYRALGGGWQLRYQGNLIPESIRTEMRERTDWGGLLEPVALQPAPAGQHGRSIDW